jgi:hypothetical protein
MGNLNRSFFDQVQAGTASEEAQLAAPRGAPSQTRAEKSGPVPLDRGAFLFCRRHALECYQCGSGQLALRSIHAFGELSKFLNKVLPGTTHNPHKIRQKLDQFSRQEPAAYFLLI